jgi:hypothetical protein
VKSEILKKEKMKKTSKKQTVKNPVYVGWVFTKNGEVKNVFAPVFAKKNSSLKKAA